MSRIKDWFNNRGDAKSNPLNQLTSEANDQFALIRSDYESDDPSNLPSAVIEGPGGNGTKAPSSYSLFNPFNLFRYSKFGLSKEEGSYNLDRHLDVKGDSPGFKGFGDQTSSIIKEFKEFGEAKRSVENPTATEIIKWSLLQANHNSDDSAVQTPVPYSPSDFLWCSHYGKVPNNRLVTLRRYPFPVEDDIRIKTDFSPPVPIAQAVTWFGSDVGNDINKIINLSWGLSWKKLPPTEVNDLTGNEIRLDDVFDTLNIGKDKDELRAMIKALMTRGGGDSLDMAALSGYDTEIQEYIRTAYGANGPYWNRILGPVNVVNETVVRDRGMAWQQDINLEFKYSLRSYGGINPKIAFLDLLTNFLSLTYNTASFWGGSVRYFEKTGVTIDGLGMENDFLAGNVEQGIWNGIEMMAAQGKMNLESIKKAAENLIADGKSAIGGEDEDIIAATSASQKKRIEEGKEKWRSKGEGAGPGNTDKASIVGRYFSQKLGKLMRKPLSFRSILDGRAIGEWHLTVGNPMSPMAMIGNLYCKSTALKVGNTLGIDDFPTEYTFTVTLGHGRPRAKQDIESIFNLGNGAMSYTALAKPASAYNSYGERATGTINTLYAAKSDQGVKANSGTPKDAYAAEMTQENRNALNHFRGRVSNKYGSSYGQSKILETYYKDVKTKD